MTDWNGFQGAAKRLDDIDIPRIANRIGAGEDELHAVIDVETGNGKGFDPYGRPKMLFEPHIFYRQLPKAKRAEAQRQGLAYPRWGEQPYPADSYPRLQKAMAIDETAALMSCSIGMGQTMAFNHKLCGYDTPEEMWRAIMDDEEHHLEAMVQFIIGSGLDDEIRRHDWAAFARGYNGAGYRKNQYDTKLASRFAWWSKRPDTPWDGAAGSAPVVEGTATIVLRRGDRNSQVKTVQQALAKLGLYSAGIDGDFGPATEAAVKAFQTAHGLLDDGWVGEKTTKALASAVDGLKVAPAERPMPIASLPANLPIPIARPDLAVKSIGNAAKQLKNEGSRTIANTDVIQDTADQLIANGKEMVRQAITRGGLSSVMGGLSLTSILSMLVENPTALYALGGFAVAILLIVIIWLEVHGARKAKASEDAAKTQIGAANAIREARVEDAITGNVAVAGPVKAAA
ncbi:N-acetylmuramidase domain-containing protein [Aurantimonas sp. VKM B-3413]|uniref:N-acetylmuramidase domain-containing protein n=1 Tax=Aurantimonas sp. VKM B-3413 TaxID=2779401 RepID=UPI001E421F6D|nr:N-acetylmuramidase domain-containing protein [Aurantimonas sp. VKM B-3413]MCB8835919.1 N-acetylmuramidase domain-containing protein [Aurantimonas sp. VKM B-3413]